MNFQDKKNSKISSKYSKRTTASWTKTFMERLLRMLLIKVMTGNTDEKEFDKKIYNLL